MAAEHKRKSSANPGSPSGSRDGSPATALAPLTSDDGFTKVQKRKQRKLDRKRPQFQYDTSYFRSGKKIGIAHIRDLSLYIAADANTPSWMIVDHHASVQHTVVVMVPGLLPSHLGLPPLPLAACLPFQTTPSHLQKTDGDLPEARVPIIPKLFSYGCPTRAPGDARKLHSVISTLLNSPLPDVIKKKREAEMKNLRAAVQHTDSNPIMYICSPYQMVANRYRLPSYVALSPKPFVPGEVPADAAELLENAHHCFDGANEAPPVRSGPRPIEVDEQGRRRKGNVRSEEGWVETPEAKGLPPNGKYPVLAIDCEMVLSEDGQELARVSVIDGETGKNLFDELVTPPKPIIDHVTQFSGITAEHMKTAKHTIESVQEALVTGPNPIITPHTILLGHSLDCDLDALKIKHPLVIDTSVIYRHARGPPYKPSLKWLTQKWLGRQIQASRHGHDSAEDAQACVDLLKMKLAHGPDFGDPNVDVESIFERLTRFKRTPSGQGRKSLVVDHGNPRSWFGAKATTAIGCTTDEEVVVAIEEQVAKHDYVFARLTELSEVQKWNSAGGEIDLTDMSDSEELSAALDKFNDRLARLHAALPQNSAFILITGNSDPRPMLDLSNRRARFEKAWAALSANGANGNGDGKEAEIAPEDRWTTEDDRQHEKAVAEAREGMAFFCVK